ncbi:pyridoxamine 5'-phosphate oxidase [Draconibacterium halophilum]|uniref:Pyridoxine/pyridoxamine 5'-phosphate oxidase n=1 Tax=Draconibacterium halophilum TaxID=2706887 RepID=A0A6C0RCF9_9BACT|nr:pyridoxamine 5'-phosphate oxidase [Draconibacterium halophilum]QIA07789.1 pyridoxamine 5'-phosphate oxidase [Draconibacterium halophilum]
MKLDSTRREYRYAALTKQSVAASPIDQFKDWLNDAQLANVNDFSAMSMITAEADGFPQSRIVLLKDISTEGFTFFTNYDSRKGKAIEKNNKVGLHFFWSELERQVRIDGIAEKTTRKESEQYFNSRPLESQIAACASAQSATLTSRSKLEEQVRSLQNAFKGEHPECPENWGGYLVCPVRIEFWQGRESRLHDRIVYELVEKEWKIKRLSP